MTMKVPAIVAAALLLAGVAWIGVELHAVRKGDDVRQAALERVASSLARLEGTLAPQGADGGAGLQSIRDELRAQVQSMQAMIQALARPEQMSLARLAGRKPAVDVPAVEAALKGADSAGKIASLIFLSPNEALDRFGTPSWALASESGVVTWFYKLPGSEKGLRLELKDGYVLQAFNR